MRRILAVLVVLGGGCTSGEPDTTIDITHDPCAPLAIISDNANELQYRGIVAAEALWADHGAPALGRRVAGSDSVAVTFEEASGVFRGLYDDEANLVYINTDLTDPDQLAIVIAHEIGHSFGLLHVDPSERQSLMNPANLTVTPTDADQAALEALWGACN